MKKSKKLWLLLFLTITTLAMNGCSGEITETSTQTALPTATTEITSQNTLPTIETEITSQNTLPTTETEITSQNTLPTTETEITSQNTLPTTETEITSQNTLPTTMELPRDYDGTNQEVIINENKPLFTQEDLDFSNGVWQIFSDLDNLNRVGAANALIGKESFPTKSREKLYIKPTGWKQKKLDNGQWFYNRCHLIGFQLTGENNNMKNLMTGTRSFNTPHMLNYENQIMDYIRLTNNHVRYRVTPYFIDDELVARGVQMEAKSVEDDMFSYNVYIFNIQDGYTIDYTTGTATKN